MHVCLYSIDPYNIHIVINIAALLRLASDLLNEPPQPQGCSTSPLSDYNLFVWNDTVFGLNETPCPWEGI
ncbi:hypothetical protein SO802_025852 [Lithocarpus litseifolius]|uniref:Uncharacterized protein n=1 Tax=Lithocarpus litseifolius TaxID=425828 RepID=A0AAW2BYE7_9ROSI